MRNMLWVVTAIRCTKVMRRRSGKLDAVAATNLLLQSKTPREKEADRYSILYFAFEPEYTFHLSSRLKAVIRTKDFSRQNPAPIGQRGPLSPAHLAPHTPVTQTRTCSPRGQREERGVARELSVNLGLQSEAKGERRPRDRRTSFQRTDRPLSPVASRRSRVRTRDQ